MCFNFFANPMNYSRILLSCSVIKMFNYLADFYAKYMSSKSLKAESENSKQVPIEPD